MKKFWQRKLSLALVFFVTDVYAFDLLSIYSVAVKDEPQLEQAQEALAAVQETQAQTRADLYLPVVNLSANVNRDFQNVQFPGSNPNDPNTIGAAGSSNFLTGGYSLTLTQPILHYDRLIAHHQTDDRIAQAETQFAAAEIGLMLRVAERYFEVLAAEENLTFAEAQQASLERKLKETEQRQAVGFLAMTDVQEAQSGYDSAVADAVEAEHQLRDAREGLQEVTGGNSHESLAPLRDEIPLLEPDPVKEESWINKALSQNLGLMTKEHGVKIAKAEISRMSAAHLPTLDAVGSQSFQTNGGRFGSTDIQDSIVGLALNVPIFQGGQVNSKTRAAEHKYREAMAALKQEQRAVQRATSKAYLGVIAGISRVKALQQALHSSETAVNATRAGFDAGYRTNLDIIIAERDRVRAQRDYTRARYDYLLNTLRLKQAVGTLSPNDLAAVNGWLEGGKVEELK